METTATDATQPTTEKTTETTTKPTENKNIASDEELLNWAKKDYEDKNGTSNTSATLNKKDNGDYEIIITDETGKLLDTYTIDPKTGTGVNSSNEEVNLPQTGNNSLKNVLVAAFALMLSALGTLCINGSGMLRRKKRGE